MAVLSIRVPADNEREPDHVEHLLDVLHAQMRRPDRVTLLLARREGRSGLCITCPDRLTAVVRCALHAYYPDAEIELIDDASFSAPAGGGMAATLRLRPDVFPLRRFSEMSASESGVLVDPLSGVLGALSLADDARADLVLRRASRGRVSRARKVVEALHRPFLRLRPRLARRFALLPSRMALLLAAYMPDGKLDATHRELMSTPDRDHEREGDIEAANDKLTAHPLFEAELRCVVPGSDKQEAQTRAVLSAIVAAYAPFARRRQVEWRASWGRQRRFLLSTEEAASLWHPPARQVRASALAVSEFTQLEPPPGLPDPAEQDVTLLGRVCFRERQDRFGLRTRDRLRHLVMVGKTGTGKSTLLASLLASDIESGRGVALFDPHGDLAERLTASIPSYRTREVVLIDAGDADHAVAFNVFDCPSRRLEPLVASGVVEVFKKLNAELSWGPRLEDLLRNSARLLLEKRGTTLISLERLLSDERFRQHATREIRDPTIRAYWQSEVPGWSKSERTAAVAAVLNKVRPFLSNPYLRNIVGQAKGKVHLREVMDEGRILIVNLSKGRLGEDACGLLGSLMLTSLQIAAMSRGDAPEGDRRPFFAYVDEFQNFATRSFSTALSEARKYGLGLTLAHQYIDQLDETTRAAVFGNVDSLVCFRVGSADAAALAEEFGGRVPEQDFVRLPRYTAYARLSVDGTPKGPFTMTTLPPAEGNCPDRSAVVRRTSNHRYARFASEVRKEIEAAYA